jgi:glycosyltransferase involved in cell wall biosynthesis
MATDTICVIIPVKNAATTIIEALESIETQTVVTNQTIVANGKKILVNVLLVFNNCTDGSEEIVND